MSCLTQARAGILFGALGAARDCLATAIDYAGTRTCSAQPAGLPAHPGQIRRHGHRVDRRLPDGPAHRRPLDAGDLTERTAIAAVSMGKLNSTRTALEIARTCRSILGANGITGDYPVMRHAANLETVLTYEGTAEIHQLVLGSALTGLDAFAWSAVPAGGCSGVADRQPYAPRLRRPESLRA